MVRLGCEGLLVQAAIRGESGDRGAAHLDNADGMGGCVRPNSQGPHDVILENSTVHNAHMFMHQFSEPFDPLYAKETCVEP